MHALTYVCVWICIHVRAFCMCVCVSVDLCINVCSYLCVCGFAYMRVLFIMYVSVCVWICVLNACSDLRVCVCPLCSSQQEASDSSSSSNLSLAKARPNSEHNNGQSPSHLKVQRSISSNQKQRRYSDQGEHPPPKTSLESSPKTFRDSRAFISPEE